MTNDRNYPEMGVYAVTPRLIQALLEQTQGNQTALGENLGVSPRTIYRVLKGVSNLQLPTILKILDGASQLLPEKTFYELTRPDATTTYAAQIEESTAYATTDFAERVAEDALTVANDAREVANEYLRLYTEIRDLVAQIVGSMGNRTATLAHRFETLAEELKTVADRLR